MIFKYKINFSKALKTCSWKKYAFSGKMYRCSFDGAGSGRSHNIYLNNNILLWIFANNYQSESNQKNNFFLSMITFLCFVVKINIYCIHDLLNILNEESLSIELVISFRLFTHILQMPVLVLMVYLRQLCPCLCCQHSLLNSYMLSLSCRCHCLPMW